MDENTLYFGFWSMAAAVIIAIVYFLAQPNQVEMKALALGEPMAVIRCSDAMDDVNLKEETKEKCKAVLIAYADVLKVRALQSSN